MSSEIMDKANAWVSNPAIDEADKVEIKKLIVEENITELTERFYRDLEFGTGGLRAILGMGLNRLNKYNVRKATQALANSIKEANSSESELRVAVSYDSRNFSFEFAKEVASVFAGNGIKSFIFDRLNPVPLLSFSVRYHKAHAGVMVTASHNPPDYNGYKAYWSDGKQVTPPFDKQIINHYNSITDYASIPVADFESAVSEGTINWVGKEVEDAYQEAILSKAISPELCKSKGENLKIVYTPIHGSGLIPCTTALKNLGFTNVAVVKEQELPDGNFPTVSSPNPENPSALKMAVDLMKETRADIVFGSDPDTDRLGVAFEHAGEIQYINGNQIGVLMLHYILSNLKEQGRLKENSYFVKTIVTTNLQETIANQFGVEGFSTLTGFKWICEKMNEMEANHPEKNFVFATEESFGYLNHDFARDKDGVSSVSLMAEVALFYKEQGMNLIEALDKIYDEYGFSSETLQNNVYEGKAGAEKILRIMENFRSFNAADICGLKIEEIEDYLSQEVKNLQTGEKRSIKLPKSNVLGFKFTGGTSLYVRPSGTEPKIKFYLLIQENEGTLEEKKSKANKLTDNVLKFIADETQNA